MTRLTGATPDFVRVFYLKLKYTYVLQGQTRKRCHHAQSLCVNTEHFILDNIALR